MAELYIGLMSGTSMDAIDAVLVRMDSKSPAILAANSTPIPHEIRKQLLALCQKGKDEIETMARMDMTMGRLFAEAARSLLNNSGITTDRIKAIGSHGQTIRHAPASNPPFSVQIGNPNVIAELAGITTVADFRCRDIAAGGQGAPLVTAFHDHLFRMHDKHRVVLNIGGIANITVLSSDPHQAVTGFDTGPGNVLMDGWIKRNLKKDRDDNGEWAASGKIDQTLLERMLNDPYFQQAPPKSTGRELFNQTWLDKILKRHRKRVFKKNVQATLCELSARSIAQAITAYAPDTNVVLVCGGGVHNLALMFRLQILLGDIKVISTEDLGVDPDYLEAIAFAWLAKQTLEGKPGNLPSVTGAKKAVVLGGIYQA